MILNRVHARLYGFRQSHAIVNASDATLARTVGAAVHLAGRFNAMADDAATAMDTLRGELVDRTLETVEGVATGPEQDIEALVVVVAADFALGHLFLVSLFCPSRAFYAEPARPHETAETLGREIRIAIRSRRVKDDVLDEGTDHGWPADRGEW